MLIDLTSSDLITKAYRIVLALASFPAKLYNCPR